MTVLERRVVRCYSLSRTVVERHAVEEVLLHALNRVGDELIDLRLVILEMTGEAVGEVVRVGKILVGTWLG